MKGDVKTSTLSRGIFETSIFNSTLNIKGDFDLGKILDKNITDNVILDEIYFSVLVSDKRNITKLPVVTIGGQNQVEYKKEKINYKGLDNGIFFKLPSMYFNKKFNFDVVMDIQGGKTLSIAPLSSENRFILSSSWPHPSFMGGWIPTTREITKDGFNATWDIPSFSSVGELDKKDVYYPNNFSEKYDRYATTSFLLPNDNYQKVDKILKYGLLFIFVPLLTLFFCEIYARVALHPVQYCLIGFANVIFYLLLLSISEHISFNLAYIISSIMGITISALYTGYTIKSSKIGLIMAFIQVLTYAFLFGVLQLVDYALLVGALGLFVILSVAMYGTRKIDWFSLKQ